MMIILTCLIPFVGLATAAVIWLVLSVDRTDHDYKDGHSGYH